MILAWLCRFNVSDDDEFCIHVLSPTLNVCQLQLSSLLISFITQSIRRHFSRILQPILSCNHFFLQNSSVYFNS